MFHEPILINVKNDNGGFLIISVFIIFFSIAAFAGLMENYHESKMPNVCPLPLSYIGSEY